MANGSFISRTTAEGMVDRFKENTTTVVNTPHGFLYDFDLIQQLINNNKGATGVRVYLGLDDSYNVKTILVATDSDGNNLFSGDNPCLDMAKPCPDECGDNPL